VNGSLISAGIVTLGMESSLTPTYPQRTPSGDLTYLPQIGDTLAGWDDSPAHLAEVSNVDQGNGSSLVTIRSLSPISDQNKQFARIKITHTTP